MDALGADVLGSLSRPSTAVAPHPLSAWRCAASSSAGRDQPPRRLGAAPGGGRRDLPALPPGALGTPCSPGCSWWPWSLLNTTHLGLSVYVFGLVRPRRTLKVFHIYFGYPLGVVIWASQTNLDNEPLHTYLTVLMFLGIGVHLLLGVRYAARRRAAQHLADRYDPPVDGPGRPVAAEAARSRLFSQSWQPTSTRRPAVPPRARRPRSARRSRRAPWTSGAGRARAASATGCAAAGCRRSRSGT